MYTNFRSLLLCLSTVIIFFAASSSGDDGSRKTNGGTTAQVVKSSDKVVLIKPGTVVGDAAPIGWTHLVFKNSSAIGAGDMDVATDTLKRLASLYSSAMVANVAGDATTGYTLGDIGYGLYTSVVNQDMVISSATYKSLGAKLGFMDSLGLSKAERRLDRLVITARTPTMAIVDSPTNVLFKNQHTDAMVRHAVMVDPQSGNLRTLIWFFLTPEKRQPAALISDINVTPSNAKINVVLHIDKNEFTLGIVTERALALNSMISGERQVAMPPAVRDACISETITPTQCGQIEAALVGL